MQKYNVAFITLYDIRSIGDNGLYQDLLREFAKNGHEVYVISTAEKRTKIHTQLYDDIEHTHILKIKIGNVQKTNIIEKGISTVLLEGRIKKAIIKYLSNVHFDLVLFSTPPITTVSPVTYLKKRDNAYTYLLLKDIFPQNALDIGLLSKSGIKKIIYQYFKNKEKRLYDISDKIGCMSQANVGYILRENKNVVPPKVEVCPNCVDVSRFRSDHGKSKELLRNELGLPNDKTIFIYGGNFGKPQDIPHIIRCIEKCRSIEDVYFLLIGDGTEYPRLANYFENVKPRNARLMKMISKDEYDRYVLASDIGLLFLDYRFTIPNFPSRMLSYMCAKKPILACTDNNSDVGKVISEIGGGVWCQSDDVNKFFDAVNLIKEEDLIQMGEANYDFMSNEYSAVKCYSIIMNALLQQSQEQDCSIK